MTQRERQPLLGSRSESVDSNASRKTRRWWRRPHPLWLIPAQLIFKALDGCQVSGEIELFSRVACRAVLSERGISIPTAATTASTDWSLPPDDSVLLPNTIFLQIPKSSESDDPLLRQCRHDPQVESRLSYYFAAVQMALGIAAALTTAYWGSLSDRLGRSPVFIVAVMALLMNDLSDIGIGTWPEVLGFKYAMFTTLLSGLLGGPLLISTLVSAYVTDTTEAGSRVNIFAYIDGVSYIGIAIGPTLGALLIKKTDLLLINWYIAVPVRLLYLLLIIFVIPESLSERLRRKETYRHNQAKKEARERTDEQVAAWRARGKNAGYIMVRRSYNSVKSAVEPLAVLKPELIEDDSTKKGKRDWTLLGVAISFSMIMAVAAMTSVKILFTRYMYNFDTAQTGYLITYMSSVRLFALFVVVPLCTKLFKSKAPVPDRPRPGSSNDDQDQPEDWEDPNANKTPEQVKWDVDAKALKVRHDAKFDLRVARWSYLFLSLGYLVTSPPTSTPAFFLAGTGIISLSAGAIPALQSLALSRIPPHEAGRLLASLNVLSSVALLIIGPPLWTFIYTKSLSFYPQLVFFIGSIWYLVALMPTLLVRIPKKPSAAEVA